MKFRALKIAGFKSFVDPIEVRIEQGLTGVVGPNGCGKSNLFESVRWVMGANSAKALRGAEMEDVIFAGTDRRPARNHAEVSLVMENEGGGGPAAFAGIRDLEVTRRIGRGTGSQYKVNGKEVRQRDVQLLFADASTGANSPALVRQGQISELVSAKPQNRRRVLEEAAGIAGLHQRRHEAELKLRAAEANLERVEEELARLETEAGRLKRQSRQAARYKRLAGEIRRTEALIHHLRWVAACDAKDAAEAALREASAATAAASAEAARARTEAAAAQVALPGAREGEATAAAVLRHVETERDAVARDIREAEAAAERLKNRLRELTGTQERELEISADAEKALTRLGEERARIEAEQAGETEAIEAADAEAQEAAQARDRAEAELERLSSEAAEARAARAAAERHRNELVARKQRLDTQIAAAEDELAGMDTGAAERIETQRTALGEAEQAAQDAREAAEAADQREAAARQAAQEAEDAVRAARAKLKELQAEQGGLERALASGPKRDWTPALDQVRPEAGYERALASALGDDLTAAVGGEAALRWAGAPAPQQDLPAGAEPLSARVEAPSELSARLSQIGVVEEAEAPSLAAQLRPGQRLVTKSGLLWRWDGYVAREDASSASAAARMEQRARLEAIAGEVAEAETGLAALRQTAEAAEAERNSARDAARQARAEASATEEAGRAARRKLETEIDAAAEAERARTTVETRLAGLTTEREEAEARLAEAQAAPDPAAEAPSDEAIEAARRAVSAARETASAARDALAALRGERNSRIARRDEINREAGNWKERGERAERQLGSVQGDIATAREQLQAARALPESLGEKRAKLEAEVEAANERAKQARDALAVAETQAQDTESAARKAESEHATLREKAAAAEQKRQDAGERLAERREEVEKSLECAPEALAERAGELMEAGLSLDDAESALEAARRQRESIGEVNLRADTELEELEKSRETLASERDDLAQAVSELRRGVDKLNGEGRTRLLEAFHVINGHFQSLFQTLFEGGEAHLELTESDDPLEAGLEIFACPPGKRLASLGLMSGGEQALTASALIFAVFLSNPAPLCVLDEVDAPLDDANVERFCNLLDEMTKRTQTNFLIITHNAVTMSRMDRLYGVTMAEKGASQLVSVDLEAAEQLAAAE